MGNNSSNNNIPDPKDSLAYYETQYKNRPHKLITIPFYEYDKLSDTMDDLRTAWNKPSSLKQSHSDLLDVLNRINKQSSSVNTLLNQYDSNEQSKKLVERTVQINIHNWSIFLAVFDHLVDKFNATTNLLFPTYKLAHVQLLVDTFETVKKE